MLDPNYEPATKPPPGKGRAVVPFHLAAEGTRRNRIAKLAKEHTLDELIAAAGKRANQDQKQDLARQLKKMKKSLRGDDKNDDNHSEDDGDSHLSQNGVSLG